MTHIECLPCLTHWTQLLAAGVTCGVLWLLLVAAADAPHPREWWWWTKGGDQ